MTARPAITTSAIKTIFFMAGSLLWLLRVSSQAAQSRAIEVTYWGLSLS